MNSKTAFAFKVSILSILLVNFRLSTAKKDCIKFNVSITQKIEHLGFHRDINWFIETENLDRKAWMNSSCSAALMLEVAPGMFVNPDQADDLRRLGKLDIFIDGTVDIEVPAHEAIKHTVYIYLNNSQLSTKLSVKLPIHLRYQRSLMGGHAKVPLNKPSLLIHCPHSNQIICGRDQKINAPVSSKDFETLWVWKNVTYKANFDEMELLVPIGNLEHYPYVATISCILGCVGCIYILSLLSNSE